MTENLLLGSISYGLEGDTVVADVKICLITFTLQLSYSVTQHLNTAEQFINTLGETVQQQWDLRNAISS